MVSQAQAALAVPWFSSVIEVCGLVFQQVSFVPFIPSPYHAPLSQERRSTSTQAAQLAAFLHMLLHRDGVAPSLKQLSSPLLMPPSLTMLPSHTEMAQHHQSNSSARHS